MSCNRMYVELCSFYSDSYGGCRENNVCLAQLFGDEEMLRKCKNCGLDKEYPELYSEIENKMKVRGERQNES